MNCLQYISSGRLRIRSEMVLETYQHVRLVRMRSINFWSSLSPWGCTGIRCPGAGSGVLQDHYVRQCEGCPMPAAKILKAAWGREDKRPLTETEGGNRRNNRGNEGIITMQGSRRCSRCEQAHPVAHEGSIPEQVLPCEDETMLEQAFPEGTTAFWGATPPCRKRIRNEG